MHIQRAVQAALLLLLAAGVAQAGNVLSSVSEHPISAPLTSTPQLKQMISDNAAEMTAALEQAGYGPLFPRIKFHIDQYPQSAINRVYYHPGQTFEWMLFRRNGQGQVLADKDVTLDSKEPLLAFEFFVYFNDWRYTAALLPGSGNLVLKESLPPMPALLLPETVPSSSPTELIRRD